MLGQFLFASPTLVKFSLCLVILVFPVLCLVYVFFSFMVGHFSVLLFLVTGSPWY